MSALKNKNINVEQLTDFNSGISSFDIARNKMVVVKTEVANPFEVYIADATAKNQKRSVISIQAGSLIKLSFRKNIVSKMKKVWRWNTG